MKLNRGAFVAKGAAILSVLPLLIYAFSAGPPPRESGAPGDGLCTQCHVGTANSGPGNVQVNFPGGMTYTPGAPQQWTVTVNDSGQRVFGFQLTVRLASDLQNGQAGDLSPVDGSTQVVRDNIGVQFIEHTQAGSSNTFRIAWTPPSTDVGPVQVYIAGNAANGDGTERGDRIYTANYTLTPAVVGPGTTPTIAQQNGVVNGASFQPGIASGSWMTVFGADLAPTTRIWRADEIVDGKLPAQLDGVSVTVNNKPAAVYYISPTQLNVQVPTDDAVGPVEVKVTTPQGRSNAVAAQMQSFAPGFFLFDPQGRKFLAAVHADGTFLGPENLFQGATTRPATPGETILLFGTGFGPTDPVVPAGQVVAQAAPLANPMTIRFGNVQANVTFAGLASGAAGLYQFNVVVPDLPDGDIPVVAEVGGVRTQDGAFITIRRPQTGASEEPPGYGPGY